MADTAISLLAALGAAPAAGDLIEVVDVSDTSMAASGTNKKLLVSELFTTPVFTTNITTPIVKSAAGSALALLATAPVATTGASQVGVAASLTASAAVASTDTAGAAAGGAVNITSGAAARNTSGNADGGAINLIGGAGIGSGLQGQVLLNYVGALTRPSIGWATYGMSQPAANQLSLPIAGNDIFSIWAGSILGPVVRSNGGYAFSTGTNTNSTIDNRLARNAAGVLAFTAGTGTVGTGWYQWAGQAYLAGDGTNATATLATTGLSVNVTTGRKYGFKCILYVSDSVAAEGVQIDFAGGTATETNFRAQATGFDTALAVSTQLDDLADVASAATFTGNGMIEINGTFEPSSTGTFIPRFAQASHVTGTLTIFRGSHLLMWDMP